MRSKKVTLAIPHALLDAYEKHAKELGYADARQMLTWCPFYSLLVRRPHAITVPLSQCPMDAQDELIEQVVGAYERGEIQHGSFFEHLIGDVVARLNINASPEVIRAVIAEVVRVRKPV